MKQERIIYHLDVSIHSDDYSRDVMKRGRFHGSGGYMRTTYGESGLCHDYGAKGDDNEDYQTVDRLQRALIRVLEIYKELENAESENDPLPTALYKVYKAMMNSVPSETRETGEEKNTAVPV